MLLPPRTGPDAHAYAADGDGHRPAAELDVDLPPESVVSGFAGLTEYATINRAVGVLIDRGQPPNRAQATLRRGAAARGLALPAYAAVLLECSRGRYRARQPILLTDA